MKGSKELALVTKSTGSWYELRSESGEQLMGRVRGKIRLKGIKVTNPVAVGDWVYIHREDESKVIIDDVKSRENYLIRRSTRKEKYGHILAANIDQAVLICTLTFPRTSLGFIDRFMVSAESFRIPTVLVFNKIDIYGPELTDYLQEIKEVYTPICKKVLATSAQNEEGLEDLKQELEGNISLMAGHSGVGKSTILNKIAPEHIEQKIGEVSTFANKGIHTTTFAEMFEIEPNTYVIDTPGIKELGLLDMADDEISHYFPEFRELFGACKFYNCTHVHEPGCAVQLAVENGSIALSRYNSYLSMVLEDETHK